MNLMRCARCEAPLDERSRSDRRTCGTTCRVGLWRLTKATTTANPDRAERESKTASTRRPKAL
jgi:hypothetical protein